MDDGYEDTHIAEEAADFDPLLSRVLAGKLELQKVLGSGAMGVVYRARHQALDKTVAIKVLRAEGKGDPSRARRFKAEARAASRLDHPNSVQILDFGEDGPDGLLYIAMEFLEGEDLQSLLKRETRLSAERTGKIMIQVLGALAAAHEHGVIHRDMKPGNIMLIRRVDDDGEDTDFVKVCDFGLAKILDTGLEDASGAPLTKQGAIFGTPAYMSPEQARGEKLDARSDLYSCGVILYKMLTGEGPFNSDTAWGLLMKHMNEAPPSMQSLVPGIPLEISAIVDKALAKRPEDRWQSAQEMRSALKGFLRGNAPAGVTRGMSQTGVGPIPASATEAVRPPVRGISDSAAPLPPTPLPQARPEEAGLLQTMPPGSQALEPKRRGLGAGVWAGIGAAVIALVVLGLTLRAEEVKVTPSPEASPLASVAQPSMPTMSPEPAMSAAPASPTMSAPPSMSGAPAESMAPPRTEEPRPRRPTPTPRATANAAPSPSASVVPNSPPPSASVAPTPPPTSAPPTPTATLPPQSPVVSVSPSAAPKIIEERPVLSVTPKEGPHLIGPKHLSYRAKVSGVKISGGVSPRRTQDALERYLPEVQKCLESGQKNLDPSGSFEVSAGVDTRGRVKNVELKTKMGLAAGCVKTVLETASVPKPDTGEASLSFTVNYEGS